MKENISGFRLMQIFPSPGGYRITQIPAEGFLPDFVFSVRGEYVIIKNQSTKIDIFCYCSLVISREVFLVSEGHRKPETYRANLCD